MVSSGGAAYFLFLFTWHIPVSNAMFNPESIEEIFLLEFLVLRHIEWNKQNG